MDTFLDKHLQLVNKNNIIEITLGCMISDNIFNGSIKYDIIKKIIKYIRETQSYKYRTYNEKIYCKRNEEISKRYNELNYSITKNNAIHFDDKLLFIKSHIQRDNIIIPSYDSYDYIKNLEILEFTIKKMFNCNISIEDERYYVKLHINKPCNKELLKTFINGLIPLY